MSYSSKTNTMRSGRTEYTRTLGYPNGFAGVDVSAPERMISQNRFAFTRNMWKDYKDRGGAYLQTFPGWRVLCNLQGRINGMWRFNEWIIVHYGTTLGAFLFAERDEIESMTVITTGMFNRKSDGFVANGAFWIIDGENYRKITYTEEDGFTASLATSGAYTPTLYASHTSIDGYSAPTQYEQRNMLSENFRENFVIQETETVDLSIGKGIAYRITDETRKYVSIYMSGTTTETTFYVPGYVTINGEKYQVDAVESMGDNTSVATLIIDEGVKHISAYAFTGWTGITHVSLPSTLRSMESYCLGGVGNGVVIDLKNPGTDDEKSQQQGYRVSNLLPDRYAFNGKTGTVYFIGSEDDLTAIRFQQNWQSVFTSWTKVYNQRSITVYRKILVQLLTDFSTITGVYLSGTQIGQSSSTRYGLITYDGRTCIYIESNDIYSVFGKTLAVEGTLPVAYFKDSEGNDVSYASCISGCRMCVEFDGRIFFAGNPSFPNRVWYTQRDMQGLNRPDYFGEINTWTDGAAGNIIVGAIPYADILVVLEQSVDGTGDIYIHSGADSGEDLTPRIYPSTYGASKRMPYSGCLNFRDDPCFVTENGVEAIGKMTVALERAMQHRSSHIDALLSLEDLSGAMLAEWEGYMVLLCPETGNAYLADSRQMFSDDEGNAEYEWYFVDGFRTELGKPTAVLSTGECLFVGMLDGRIILVNADKRGEAYDGDTVEPWQIHRHWYERDGEGYRSELTTRLDDCGYPNVTKDTVYASLVLTAKCETNSALQVSCRTDRHNTWMTQELNSRLNFNEADFSNMALSVNELRDIVLNEHERLWVVKQYNIGSEEIHAPWGLDHITYRWHVCRRIK